jgi:hypothetical protein
MMNQIQKNQKVKKSRTPKISHQDLEGDNTPRISLATITSISQPQTLKLKGHIKNDNVTVLIDTGSTLQMEKKLRM